MHRIIAWLHATWLQRQRASIGVELMRGMFRTPHLDAVWCKEMRRQRERRGHLAVNCTEMRSGYPVYITQEILLGWLNKLSLATQ